MASLQPVDFDPFADGPAPTPGVQRVYIGEGVEKAPAQPRMVPVDHDPFAKMGYAEDAVKSLGSGVAKGAAALVGAPSDISEFGAQGIDWLTRKVGEQLGIDIQARNPQEPKFGSKDVEAAITRVVGELHKPQTRVGEYAQTIGEFAPGVFGPGGAVAKLAQVIIPALASETAGQVTKGTVAEPFARFGGAIAGGGLTALLSRPGTATRALKSQLPEGITAQHVDQAEALINSAKGQGIDLAWPEALSQVAGRPVLTNTMRHLEASPQTEAQMAQFFGGRPQQIENAARGQFDNLSPVNTAPSTIGPAVGRAAEETVGDVRGAINKTAKPFYDAAESVRLSPQDMAKVRALPGFDDASKAVRGDPQLNRYVSHLPDDSVGFLNEVKKELDRAGKAAVGPLNTQPNMQRAAGLGSDASVVKNTAVNASTDYGTALAVESVAREKYLQPLLDGPIGKLASKDTATKDAINALFPKNPLPNSEHEIGIAVSALAKRNPGAAKDLVRAHVESVFNEAAKDLQSGANQAGGAKFRAQLIGNPQQRLNLREAVEALPNGQDRWSGFNKFLDILEATGTRQNVGSRTAYNAELLKQQATGGLVGDAIKTGANPARFGQKFIDRYEQYKLGKNLGQLADILTDPRSADLLRSIAKSPVGSTQAQAVALRLITYYDASHRTPVEKPGK